MALPGGGLAGFVFATIWLAGEAMAAPLGYYRQPALYKDTIVFVAEGDLWKVGASGGQAVRLTSHPADESNPAVSPDGKTVAFVGRYEGPPEVYTMPLEGGLPVRRTYDGEPVSVAGWTRDGRILCATRADSTLPDTRLVTLDISRDDTTAISSDIPLAQAADGTYDASGKTLYFTRLPHQGSHTKRYRGGTAQNIWRYTSGESEAVPLTQGFAGTSAHPMYWQDRVYFVSDRDGTMNLWSMSADGRELRQHTKHVGWDVTSPSLSEGRIVYQLGADLWLFDIASDSDRAIPITLSSDLDQMREHWVKNPLEYVSAAHLSADGSHVALTARGEVFVAPDRQGRLVQATHSQGVRYRDARFMPGGNDLLVLSDQTGETEFFRIPANGVGRSDQLTRDAAVLRWEGIPSPDGRYIAHHDKNERLFILDLQTRENRQVDESPVEDFFDLKWSPDSKWLAYVAPLENLFHQIRICRADTGKTTPVTSDRYDSFSPAWSPDGKWLYFLSNRNLSSVVGSPWGAYEPQPFLDKQTGIYLLALSGHEDRSPFAPNDELHSHAGEARGASTRPATQPHAVEVKIDLEGIESRLIKAPVAAGNYGSLAVNDKGLFWISSTAGQPHGALVGAPISNEDMEVKTIVADVSGYEMSQDGKKILAIKPATRGHGISALFIIDANPAPADLSKKQVDLSGLAFSVIPREEWQAMFEDAWRMERDYFYDRNMQGVDWKGMREKYQPLLARVTTREELSDLIAQLVSELSALHTFVEGGDMREGSDRVMSSSLGAKLVRDTVAGGYRVEHIYRTDPDEPDLAGPLARFGVNVKEGDTIELIDGTPTLSVPDVSMLLRQQEGRQILLRIKPHEGSESRDVIVRPISVAASGNLRYHEWEYTRRQAVEKMGDGQIGYVHLRAMGGGDFTEWAKGFYPVWNRQGLIIDVRHNRGGNIDSWIIDRLLRKAWSFWSTRTSDFSTWNMQYAFRGHVVVLCDEWTASDGEAFTEGIKRLKLGKVIGTRTWGGEIWLSFDNVLVDHGIASAAEMGVYGPEGAWLIEGHGVDPDVVVDNLPHATFMGQDAQLQAAIDYLQKRIKQEPIKPIHPPKYPDKSFKGPKPRISAAR